MMITRDCLLNSLCEIGTKTKAMSLSELGGKAVVSKPIASKNASEIQLAMHREAIQRHRLILINEAVENDRNVDNWTIKHQLHL